MIRAVICDDEKAAIRIISRFLETEGFPIRIVGTAADGRSAYELIRREKPELVFMDIHMPYMNGFEVIQQMEQCKVIVITAYDSFAYAQKALRLGACDILSKPIEFDQLRQAIVRAIGWKFTGNDRVDTAVAFIYENYTRQIGLEDVAAATFCSVNHIARMFKKHMNMTILEFIHKVRIEHGVRLLEEGTPVKEAAEKTGYQNLNNFYKYFKLYTGTTPAAYGRREQDVPDVVEKEGEA